MDSGNLMLIPLQFIYSVINERIAGTGMKQEMVLNFTNTLNHKVKIA